jgi:hypothetical protein
MGFLKKKKVYTFAFDTKKQKVDQSNKQVNRVMN